MPQARAAGSHEASHRRRQEDYCQMPGSFDTPADVFPICRHMRTLSSMTPEDAFPTLAAWRRRKSGMPTVPGGHESHLVVLRDVLGAFVHTLDNDALVPWPSATVQATAATIANQLAPAGLLLRLPGRKIGLTDPAQQWLAGPNDAFLISIFHENIRFVGELLFELRDDGLTAEELRKIAAEKYRLGWSSLDQVTRRCAWLRVAGMAELRYDHDFVLTQNGRDLLGSLNIVDSAVLGLGLPDDDIDPASLPTADSRIQEILDNITNESLRLRSSPSLYIPKGPGSRYDSLTSLRTQLDAIGPRIKKDDFLHLCEREFDSAASSAISALDTLRHSGLVKQTGFNTFDTTDAAHAWLESAEDIDLVRILHGHIRCMGELIELVNEATSIARLAEEVNKRYAIRLSRMALRQRLQILRECGLVDHDSATTYLATSRGRAFGSTLEMEVPIPAEDRIIAQPQSPAENHGTSALIESIRSAARDPRQPTRFEELVVTAFRRLGLSAEHLGGPGDTDVLVTINKNPISQVKVIVDAKTTGHASVLENAIDFTTLEEHRRQHDASHVALVAIGFEAGRIIKRARDNDVALIRVDDLAFVLARHDTAPLTPIELLALFDARQRRESWAEADRRNLLVAVVTRAIAEEAEYVEESGESFSAKDIHKSVRREIDGDAPSMDEIRNILDFLASPLIGGVIRDGKGGYQPGVTAEGIATRLRALASAAAGSL
jgi:hypothetical protein